MSCKSIVFPALPAGVSPKTDAVSLPATNQEPPGILDRVWRSLVLKLDTLIFFLRPGGEIDTPRQLFPVFAQHKKQIDNIAIKVIQNFVFRRGFLEKDGGGTGVRFQLNPRLWKVL